MKNNRELSSGKTKKNESMLMATSISSLGNEASARSS